MDLDLDLLRAVVAADVAAISPEDLAAALGLDAEAATPRIVAALASGWLDHWDHPAGPLLCLSPLAADRLGVVLAEPGYDETPRWRSRTDRPPSARTPGWRRDYPEPASWAWGLGAGGSGMGKEERTRKGIGVDFPNS